MEHGKKCLFWNGFGQAVIFGAIFTVIVLLLRLLVATTFDNPNAVPVFHLSYSQIIACGSAFFIPLAFGRGQACRAQGNCDW